MSRNSAFSFLCDCLNPLAGDDVVQELRATLATPNFSWEELVIIASEHKVSAMMSNTLIKFDLTSLLPSDLVDYFEGVAELNRQRNEQIYHQALELSATLNAIGIVPVFLKGTGNLLSKLYEEPEHRVMIDIDILVPQASLAECVAALKKHHYAEPDLDIVVDPWSHHYPPLTRKDRIALVELHTEVIAYPHTNLMPATQVLSDAQQFKVENSTFAVPSLQNRMIHTIAHNQVADQHFFHGFVLIRQFVECLLLQKAARGDLNWFEIETRFAAGGLHLPYACQIVALNEMYRANLPVPKRSIRAGKLFLKRAIFQIGYPRTATVTSRILNFFSLFKRSISDRELIWRLIQNLTRPDWFRRRWRSLFGK